MANRGFVVINASYISFLFVLQFFTALIVLLVVAAIFVKVHTKVTSGGKEGKLSFSVMLSE